MIQLLAATVILCRLCNEISAIFGGGDMMLTVPIQQFFLGGGDVSPPLSPARFTPLIVTLPLNHVHLAADTASCWAIFRSM